MAKVCTFKVKATFTASCPGIASSSDFSIGGGCRRPRRRPLGNSPSLRNPTVTLCLPSGVSWIEWSSQRIPLPHSRSTTAAVVMVSTRAFCCPRAELHHLFTAHGRHVVPADLPVDQGERDARYYVSTTGHAQGPASVAPPGWLIYACMSCIAEMHTTRSLMPR